LESTVPQPLGDEEHQLTNTRDPPLPPTRSRSARSASPSGSSYYSYESIPSFTNKPRFFLYSGFRAILASVFGSWKGRKGSNIPIIP
jgi:hypothetical protein